MESTKYLPGTQQRFLLQMLAFIVLGCISIGASAINLTTYFPYAAGNQWNYQNNTLATMSTTVGSPVLLPSGVTAIPATIINSSEAGTYNTYSTVDINGLSRHQEFMSNLFVAGVGNISVTATFTPALVLAPIDVIVGGVYTSSGTVTVTYTNVMTVPMNYTSSTEIVGFETVTDFSGIQSWSALKVITTTTISGLVNGIPTSVTDVITNWLVDGIGVVQTIEPNQFGVMETWKLTSTNVVKANQTIVAFSVLPASLTIGGTATANAIASSGLPVSFSSLTPAVCTVVNGNIINGNAFGLCIIVANQVGNAAFNPALQATQLIGVERISQFISFGAAPTLVVGGIGVVTATGGGSGNAVVFSSLSPGICSISGNSVMGVAAGTCTIAADQLGNALYSAAQAWLNFDVIQPLPAVSISAASLNFASQNIGITSAAQTVTLTNSGTAALNIASIVASGNFAQTNNCGAGLAVGASCVLTVDYTSAVAGISTGALTITSDASTSPTLISLYGMGGTPSTVATNLVPGWNLIGNSINTPLDVAMAFGDPIRINTVWKWVPATSRWAFYAPSMTATALTTYASTKSYDVLITVNGGEGFWVNAKTAFPVPLPGGTAVSSTAFANQLVPPNLLPMGWSLIATGDNPAPRNFVNLISTTPPVAPAVAATSLTTLWAWDSALSNWYFYAPSLDNAGTMPTYITTKGYLNFGAKTLDQTMGFWVNHP